MEKKYYLILDKEFVDYCKLNNIDDVEKLAREIFGQGFNTLKYGNKPNVKIYKPPIEKIVEKITSYDLVTSKDLYGE